MSNNLICGHEWEDMLRAQQGGRLHKPIDTSKPISHALTPADIALVDIHGTPEALDAAGFCGTADKLRRSQSAKACDE